MDIKQVSRQTMFKIIKQMMKHWIIMIAVLHLIQTNTRLKFQILLLRDIQNKMMFSQEMIISQVIRVQIPLLMKNLIEH